MLKKFLSRSKHWFSLMHMSRCRIVASAIAFHSTSTFQQARTAKKFQLSCWTLFHQMKKAEGMPRSILICHPGCHISVCQWTEPFETSMFYSEIGQLIEHPFNIVSSNKSIMCGNGLSRIFEWKKCYKFLRNILIFYIQMWWSVRLSGRWGQTVFGTSWILVFSPSLARCVFRSRASMTFWSQTK